MSHVYRSINYNKHQWRYMQASDRKSSLNNMRNYIVDEHFHYCVRWIFLFAPGNHASDISDSVVFRGGILHRNGNEGTHLSSFLQTSNEAERDPRLQTRIHLYSDRVREERKSGGKDPGSSWAREDSVAPSEKLPTWVSKLRALWV